MAHGPLVFQAMGRYNFCFAHASLFFGGIGFSGERCGPWALQCIFIAVMLCRTCTLYLYEKLKKNDLV